MKCITEFVAQETSHVVSDKRNTALVLQALVAGRFIITTDYISAISKVAERTVSNDANTTMSLLEQDYDLYWPKELDYLTPPGNEPNPREEHDKVFLPEPKRAEVFNKYMFIFCSRSQYDMFLAVITSGGGKALLKEVTHPDTDPDFDEFLAFVMSCAGIKDGKTCRLSDLHRERGGVIVVRPSNPHKVGGVEFFQKLDLSLDQRSVVQNEFLDAIINNDARPLRRALEVDYVDDESHTIATSQQRLQQPALSIGNDVTTSSNPPQTDATTEVPKDNTTTKDATASTKPKIRKHFNVQKIETFDDFDPSQIVPVSEVSQSESSFPAQSQRFIETNDDELHLEGVANSQVGPSQSQPPISRKRAAESQLQPIIPTTSEVLDSILPYSTAIKKRRLEEEASSLSNKRPLPKTFESNDPSPVVKKQKTALNTVEEEQDLQKTMQARRKQEDTIRERDEESLRNAIPDGMEVSQLKDVAVIVEMPIIPRSKVSRHSASNNTNQNGDDEHAWKPEWNGRANWKGFKKRRPARNSADDTSQTPTTARRDDGPIRRRVIVTLEEFDPYGKSSDRQDYWLLDTLDSARSRNRYNSSLNTDSNHSQSQTLGPNKQSRSKNSHRRSNGHDDAQDDSFTAQEDDDDDDDLLSFSNRRRKRATNVESRLDISKKVDQSRLNDAKEAELHELDEDEIGDMPRDQELRTAARKVDKTRSNTGSNNNKRRRDVVEVVDVEEEDDEDDGGLQFKRRRR